MSIEHVNNKKNRKVEFIKFVADNYVHSINDKQTLIFYMDDKCSNHGIYSGFNVCYINEIGEKFAIGNNKIYVSDNLEKAYINRVILNGHDTKSKIENFKHDKDIWCSIGNDLEYYEKLREVVFGNDRGCYYEFLTEIGDLVINPSFYDSFDSLEQKKIKDTLFREQVTTKDEKNCHTLYEISKYCKRNGVSARGDEKDSYRYILDKIIEKNEDGESSSSRKMEQELENLIDTIPNRHLLVDELIKGFEKKIADNYPLDSLKTLQIFTNYLLDNKNFDDDIKSRVRKIQGYIINDENSVEFIRIVEKIRRKLQVSSKELEDLNNLGQYTGLETLYYLFGEEEKTVRLTHYRQLNDPLEGKVLLDIICPEKDCDDSNVSYIFISSATTNLDSLPMWNQYGQGATGVSLTYSTDFLNKLLDETDVELYRMCYLEEKEGSTLAWINGKIDDEIGSNIDSLKNIVKENTEVGQLRKYRKYLSSIAYLMKNKDYSYEDEYRMVIEFSAKNNKIIAEKKKDFPVPFLYTYVNKKDSDEKLKVEYSKIRLGPKAVDIDFVRPYIKFITDSTKIIEKSKIKFR